MSAIPHRLTASCSTRIRDTESRRVSSGKKRACSGWALAMSEPCRARSRALQEFGAMQPEPVVKDAMPNRPTCDKTGRSPMPLTTRWAEIRSSMACKKGSVSGSLRGMAYLTHSTKPSATRRSSRSRSMYCSLLMYRVTGMPAMSTKRAMPSATPSEVLRPCMGSTMAVW